MTEEEKIPPKKIPKENKTEPQLETTLPTGQAGSSAEPITKAEQTANEPSQPKQNMEVHHHGHVHEKKKWKEYVFQFFMLFLAVFCGFLAEYQLEHVIENNREKQYMNGLYSDLKADTVFINDYINKLIIIQKELDTLITLYNTGQYMIETETYYRLALDSRKVWYFQYNNSTFEQLRGSGNLRLLRDHEFANNLMLYDNNIRDVLKKQESRYLAATASHTALQWEILDANIYASHDSDSSYINHNYYVASKPIIHKDDAEKFKKLNNLFFEKRLIIPFYLDMMFEARKSANQLILSLKKKYDLE